MTSLPATLSASRSSAMLVRSIANLSVPATGMPSSRSGGASPASAAIRAPSVALMSRSPAALLRSSPAVRRPLKLRARSPVSIEASATIPSPGTPEALTTARPEPALAARPAAAPGTRSAEIACASLPSTRPVTSAGPERQPAGPPSSRALSLTPAPLVSPSSDRSAEVGVRTPKAIEPPSRSGTMACARLASGRKASGMPSSSARGAIARPESALTRRARCPWDGRRRHPPRPRARG